MFNTSNPERPRALRCQSAPLRHGEALIDGAVVSFHPRHGHINDSPPLPYTLVMTNLVSYTSLCPGLGIKR